MARRAYAARNHLRWQSQTANDVAMAWFRGGGRRWAYVAFLSRVAWPGVALGSVLAALLFAAAVAWPVRSGLGTAVDVLVGVVLAALAMALAGLGVIVLRSILRAWPALFAAGF